MPSRLRTSGCQQRLSPLTLAAVWCFFVATLACLCPPHTPAEAARTADRIVAIVNDEVITLSEMKADIRGEESRLREQYQGAELDHRLGQLHYRALTRLIERKLQIQVAKKRGHEVTDEEVQRAMREYQRQGEPIDETDPQLLKTIKEQLIVWKVLEREVRSGVLVSEDELKRYYEEHRERFMLPAEYHISQILIQPREGERAEETQQRAREVYAALKDGGDFADLARRMSDGAQAAQGGSLGLITQGELEQPIEDAIARLQPGDISEPISTDNGYHIIRLDERKPSEFRQYAEVKAEIQNLVYQQKSNDEYYKWIEELKDKAYIEVKF